MADTAFKSSFDGVPASNLGSIAIRVVVLPPAEKKGKPEDTSRQAELAEAGLDPDELDEGTSSIASYLEHGRGKNCVVFLINGQRHDVLDKSFIVRELDFKYIASRMMIIVDLDGLTTDAIRRFMQGSRQVLYKGEVWDAILARVAATLKNAPDLIRLEEEAEAKVSELQAGDEKVRQALDQLIDAHHDRGLRVIEGAGTPGNSQDDSDPGLKIIKKGNVVMLLRTGKGDRANFPVLIAKPASIHFAPDETKQVIVTSNPADAWPALANLIVDSNTIPGLQVTQERSADRVRLKLEFCEPPGFDQKWPVLGKLAASARFNGFNEWRRVEIGVTIEPDEEKEEVKLLDDPTMLKVMSRSPVTLWKAPAESDEKTRRKHGDTHVRLRWDGKDELITGTEPAWRHTARIISPERAGQPAMSFAMPRQGRFSLLVSPRPEWKVGQEFTFEVAATRISDGHTLATTFVMKVEEEKAEEEAKPRLVGVNLPTGSNRRAPYDILYINRSRYEEVPCWDGKTWTDADAASYLPPSSNAPLRFVINNDMTVLDEYRRMLRKKRTGQALIERKITKYATHVGYHLYQMYQAFIGTPPDDEDFSTAEARRRDEISRVSVTLIRLMD